MAVILIGGCGFRHTEFSDGSHAYEYYAGLSELPACDGQRVVGVRETLVGVWAQEAGAGMGVKVGRYACLSQRCQIIVWVDGDETAEALRRRVEALENVCVRS